MSQVPSLSTEFTTSHSINLSPTEKQQTEFLWKLERATPFDECMISWNGYRPKTGKWTIQIRLEQDGNWSPWIRYAEWTAHSQRTFKWSLPGCFVESYQDAVYPKDKECRAFQVKVVAEQGAGLQRLDAVHVCTSSLSAYKLTPSAPHFPSTLLDYLPLRSQLCLNHPRASDLCSPTAATTAINCLLRCKHADPIPFSAKVHDDGFDIYGNWVLNTAQAYEELQGKFYTQVMRLPDFAHLHALLVNQLPVVVSVRGPLVGTPHPMTFGHLICVVGYNADSKHVLCIDSGFPEDSQTFASYPYEDFMQAWSRRHQVAYVFTKK